MIYVCIDIETTGLDPEYNDIVEFAAIIEDTDLQLPFEIIPKYSVLIEQEEYTGSPYALAMHKEIFDELAKKPNERKEKVIDIHSLAESFHYWLWENLTKNSHLPIDTSPIKINVAGKNFSWFDYQFLKNVHDFTKLIKINHRVIDPSTLYYDQTKDNDSLPGLDECKIRAGLDRTSIRHRALYDAMDVIEVLRGKMYAKIKAN